MKIWARERYFVRINDVPQEAIDALEKKYTFHFFEERACEQCEWVGLRRQQGLLGECEACAAYRGSALLANKVKIKENQYLATPLGDFEGLCKILKRYVKEDIKKVEKHPIIPIKPIKFMGEPRGYQEEAVASCIRGEKGVLYAPPRSGKCVSGNSMIMTPQGLLPIKDLFPHHIPEEYTDFRSTKIATRFGPRITQGFYAKMVDQTIRITDSNGYVIEGTPNHKILIQDQNLNQVWRKLEDLHVGDVIVHSRKQQWLCRKTPSIPRVNPQRMQRVLYTPRKMTVELAELLGFWVANGNLRRETLNISTYSRRIQQRITECLDKIFPDLHYRVEHDGIYISSSYLSNWLAQPAVGLRPCRSAQKEIPNIILRSDKKYVDAFLRAYLSCDSWIHAQGMELCIASAKLIYQLQVLLSFYGVRCRRKRVLNFARNGTRIKRPYFKLLITSDVHNLAFLNLYKEWKVNANKNQTDVIYYGYDVFSRYLYCLHRCPP